MVWFFCWRMMRFSPVVELRAFEHAWCPLDMVWSFARFERFLIVHEENRKQNIYTSVAPCIFMHVVSIPDTYCALNRSVRINRYRRSQSTALARHILQSPEEHTFLSTVIRFQTKRVKKGGGTLASYMEPHLAQWTASSPTCILPIHRLRTVIMLYT